MHSRIVACAAQIAPVYMDRKATTDKIVATLREAGKLGARIAAFPETVLPGYPYWTLFHDPFYARKQYARALYEQSVRLDDETVVQLRQAAREADCVAVIGINEIDGATLYNSQLVIDADGSILGCRRKLMPTHHERITWGHGDGADLATYDSQIGKLGALVCYEHANPLFRYAIHSQGEQIHVANWPGGMPWTYDVIDASVRSYSIESAAFVVSTTAIVDETIIGYLGDAATTQLDRGGGCSAIVAPGGKYLARAKPDREELLCAELDFGLILDWKHIVDSSGHYARPDVLQLQIASDRQLSVLRRHSHS